MSETMSLIFGGTYFCMFAFFLVSCISSVRSFRHLKSYSRAMEDLYKTSQEKQQISWIGYTRTIQDLSETVHSLEKKIDELRLQVGIINGRMGDYNRVINIPPSSALTNATERKKPGPKPGSTRKPKEISKSQ